MKTLLTLLSIIILLGNVSAQTFEGKITFSIDYELPEAMESQRAMLPSEMIIYISKNHTRLEQKTMMGDQDVITNTKTKTSVLLLNMMGKKMAVTMKSDEDNTTPPPTVEYTKDIKAIAGYICRKAIYITKDANGEEQRIEIYYTKKIPSTANDKLPGLKGYPLEYTINTQGMVMTLTAKKISREKISKSLFEIPDGYDEISMEEFMKSMGQ